MTLIYVAGPMTGLIRCDAVALLPGWEASGGARLEVNVAATLGMRVAPLEQWLAEAIA